MHMQEGRTKDIIEKLIDNVENGQGVPLMPGKVGVNRDETLTLLRELASIVDGELKVYRDITDRKGKILTEAKQEAEEIVAEAERNASRIRVTKRMGRTGQTFNDKSFDMEDAETLRTANDIYAASVIYTDEMLTEVNDVIARAVGIMNDQYAEVMNTLAEKAKRIEANKAELMAGLKELSEEDRYSQIMELAQLLSNELYRERMKKLAAERKTERVHIPAGHIDDYGRTQPAKPEVEHITTPAAKKQVEASGSDKKSEAKQKADNLTETLRNRGRAETKNAQKRQDSSLRSE